MVVHSENPVGSLETFCKFSYEDALKHLANLPMNILFWNSQKRFISISPQALEIKYYYLLGKLGAVSISCVGYEPECVCKEPANYIFCCVLKVDFILDYSQFNSDLANIEDIFD